MQPEIGKFCVLCCFLLEKFGGYEKAAYLCKNVFKQTMIMRLLDYSNIESTPVWNEVKNWSDDEKSALITLLYTTMNKVNPYVVPESEEVDAFVNEIPREVLAASVEMALKDHESGNAISHSDFMNRIKEERGWK